MSKPVNIPIEKIQNRFDVRKALDDDTVLHLAELYQAKVQLPPVSLVDMGDGTYSFIDGRHRAAAKALLGDDSIPAIVQPMNGSKGTMELYAQALRANYGGSKPPTREDIQHTVHRMVEQGAGLTAISRLIDFIPNSMLHNMVAAAKGHINRDKMRKAIQYVAEGSNPAEAAKKFGVEPKAVSDAIAGRKRKWSTGEGTILAENKNHITRVLKAANLSIGKHMQDLLNQVEAGEVSPETVAKILNAWETHNKGTAHRIRDWRERLAHRSEERAEP